MTLFTAIIFSWPSLTREQHGDLTMLADTAVALSAVGRGSFSTYRLQAEDVAEAFTILNLMPPADYKLRPMSLGDLLLNHDANRLLMFASDREGWKELSDIEYRAVLKALGPAIRVLPGEDKPSYKPAAVLRPLPSRLPAPPPKPVKPDRAEALGQLEAAEHSGHPVAIAHARAKVKESAGPAPAPPRAVSPALAARVQCHKPDSQRATGAAPYGRCVGHGVAYKGCDVCVTSFCPAGEPSHLEHMKDAVPFKALKEGAAKVVRGVSIGRTANGWTVGGSPELSLQDAIIVYKSKRV